MLSPSACGPQDLLVVVPWHLKNVLSGEPVVYKPYIEQARQVAEVRNWFWTNCRNTKDSLDKRQVKPPDQQVGPYPAPKTKLRIGPLMMEGKTSVASHGSLISWTLTHLPCGGNGSPEFRLITGSCFSSDTRKQKIRPRSSTNWSMI